MLSFLNDKIIESRKGRLDHHLEVRKRSGKYILDADHVNYSYGGLHRVFRDAFKKTGISGKKINDVLILGFGAGSVAGILTDEYHKNCKITGVEADEVVIEMAEKYFKLDRYRQLDLIRADAADFVAHDNNSYDLIIVDIYLDFTVPAFAESKLFLGRIKQLLRENGLMFFNKIIYNMESEVSAAKLKANLIGTFAGVKEYSMKYAVSNTMYVCNK